MAKECMIGTGRVGVGDFEKIGICIVHSHVHGKLWHGWLFG